MNKDTKENWEKEFDEKFGVIGVDKNEDLTTHPWQLKDFIRYLLSSERQRLIKSIQGLPCKEDCVVLKSRVLKLYE